MGISLRMGGSGTRPRCRRSRPGREPRPAGSRRRGRVDRRHPAARARRPAPPGPGRTARRRRALAGVALEAQDRRAGPAGAIAGEVGRAIVHHQHRSVAEGRADHVGDRGFLVIGGDADQDIRGPSVHLQIVLVSGAAMGLSGRGGGAVAPGRDATQQRQHGKGQCQPGGRGRTVCPGPGLGKRGDGVMRARLGLRGEGGRDAASAVMPRRSQRSCTVSPWNTRVAVAGSTGWAAAPSPTGRWSTVQAQGAIRQGGAVPVPDARAAWRRPCR